MALQLGRSSAWERGAVAEPLLSPETSIQGEAAAWASGGGAPPQASPRRTFTRTVPALWWRPLPGQGGCTDLPYPGPWPPSGRPAGARLPSSQPCPCCGPPRAWPRGRRPAPSTVAGARDGGRVPQLGPWTTVLAPQREVGRFTSLETGSGSTSRPLPEGAGPRRWPPACRAVPKEWLVCVDPQLASRGAARHRGLRGWAHSGEGEARLCFSPVALSPSGGRELGLAAQAPVSSPGGGARPWRASGSPVRREGGFRAGRGLRLRRTLHGGQRWKPRAHLLVMGQCGLSLFSEP